MRRMLPNLRIPSCLMSAGVAMCVCMSVSRAPRHTYTKDNVGDCLSLWAISFYFYPHKMRKKRKKKSPTKLESPTATLSLSRPLILSGMQRAGQDRKKSHENQATAKYGLHNRNGSE